MGEYFGKTLVLEQLGVQNCRKSGISCWNAYMSSLYGGFLPAVSSLGSWRPSED